ncbi:hypothetical protein J2785_002880 [Burkholderia ambifaria]|nr:hypothetical protein [Burkholderia ambifaria]
MIRPRWFVNTLMPYMGEYGTKASQACKKDNMYNPSSRRFAYGIVPTSVTMARSVSSGTLIFRR